MSNVSQWSTVAGNNNDTAPDGWPEAMPRSSVNDAAREMMAALAKWYGDTDGSLTSAGTASAYTLTTNSAHAALADQSLLVFKAHVANNAAPTLYVDNIAVKTIKAADGSDLPAGAIAENQVVTVAYNATTDTYNVQGGARTRLVGEVIDYAGSTAPSGWLLCYGQAVSRTTYATLFGVISTTYGSGDGSTTFNLPDLRGRVVAGQDDMGGTSANRLLGTGGSAGPNGDTLGAAGGAETHTITQSNLPSQNLNVRTSLTAQSGSGAREVVAAGGTEVAAVELGGSDTPINIIQPTIILNKIIYTGV